MHLIGLTGGIATGKSTVAGLLTARGATVVDADELAREVVEPGQRSLAEIRQRFGAGVIAASGALDRAALGAIVFADEQARRDLERITHPRIAALMQERVAAALAQDAELVVVDVPLLFENHRQDQFEGVMLVYAPPSVQVERVMRRDGLDEPAARQRLAAQMAIDEKRQLATWVIDNSGDAAQTKEQIDHWWDALVNGQL
ncbi:MAG: dephospho-CoA kinase [Candidatus Dormibacteraeota bacterium]|nr:dephospho-CoA kinase [Candidatus Dormibacteraeota bacterium]